MPRMAKATATFVGIFLLLMALGGDEPQITHFGIAWGRVFMIALAFVVARLVYKHSGE